VFPTSLAICLGIFLAMAGPAAGAAGELSRVVVFGDSLSDPANAFPLLRRVEHPTFEPIPDAP
jgi:hypothetical protein